MKSTFKFFSVIMVVAVMAASCHTTKVVIVPKKESHSHAKKVPPGQAKKMDGSKSAKSYAPGQQKKKH